MVPVLLTTYVCLSVMRFAPYDILYHVSGTSILISIPHSMEKHSKTRLMEQTRDIDTNIFFIIQLLLSYEIPKI